MTERSNWGKKVPLETRMEMYSTLIRYLQQKQNYSDVALCKETLQTWEKLTMDYRNIKCNCIF
jgi:spore photoproduct lyase